MIILGLIGILLGYFLGISILYYIGGILLIIGLVLLLLGSPAVGHPVGGRRYWW